MVGISAFDLIPNAFLVISYNYSVISFILLFLIFLIIVILVFKLINKIRDTLMEKGSNLLFLGVISMITLIIHNLPEGMATFLSSYRDINLGIKLGIAIMLHNIPEGICIAVPIYYATNNKTKAIMYTLLSGLSEPIGALLAFLLFKNHISISILNIILLFVGIIMIYLGIEEIYPIAREYNKNSVLVMGLLVGLCIVIIGIII